MWSDSSYKPSDDFKRVYAVCRGTFPIHELCGTMTALLLARRDVIGVNLPLWKILGPAVFIHGMANFRGMKVSCGLTRLCLPLSPTMQISSHICVGSSSVPIADIQMEFINSLV